MSVGLASLAVVGLLAQVPESIAEHANGYGLAGLAILQVGGIVMAHVKGRGRDAGRRSEYARLETKIDRNQHETQSSLSDISKKFEAHAAADASAFAEIANSFTEIGGTLKLHQQINDTMATNLGTVAADLAETTRREMARLDRQATATDRRQS